MAIIRADITYDDGTLITFTGVSQDASVNLAAIPTTAPVSEADASVASAAVPAASAASEDAGVQAPAPEVPADPSADDTVTG